MDESINDEIANDNADNEGLEPGYINQKPKLLK